jgi:hypothetical protein
VGTDPWADDCWGSEPDVAQVPLPVPLLTCYGIGNPNEATVHFPPRKEETDSGFIFPVNKGAWKSWEAEYASPDPIFSCRQLELMVRATIKVGSFSCQASVLVDTGCRIPLLFKKGLIPVEFLEPARRPIRISTADGTPMSGGSRGCVLRVTLPVAGLDGTPETEFHCEAHWGYEAAVHSCDLILGYPFLKIFRLVVDCPTDSLKSLSIPTSTPTTLRSTTTTSTTRLPTPTSKQTLTSSKQPTDDFHTGAERKPAGPCGSRVSSPPIDSPGTNAKAADLDVNGKSSSNPVLRQPRPTAGHLTSGCPVSPQPTPSLCLLLPDSATAGTSVDPPPTLPQTQGDCASITPFTPPLLFFQCSQCLRRSTLPDFDCGCMCDEAHLLRSYLGRMPSRTRLQMSFL